MEWTRREILGAGAFGSCMLCSCMRQESKSGGKRGGDFSGWRYHKLDPESTAERAYVNYYEHGCMYGVFKSVVGQLGERHGQPYSSFPYGMLTYGAGGVAGWGSLCGALNGSAAVIGLFAAEKEQQEELIRQVFRWYERTELPVHVPAAPRLDAMIPSSACGSVLCHVSVGGWTNISGYSATSKERKERCARLTADTVRRTVAVLNEGLLGGVAHPLPADEQVSGCNSCHGRESSRKDALTAMPCGGCHMLLPEKHPDVKAMLPKQQQ